MNANQSLKLLPKTEPSLVSDVAFMKAARGDSDVAQFEKTANEWLMNGVESTIQGAIDTMTAVLRMDASAGWSDQLWARMTSFLNDLRAVEGGDRHGWTPPAERGG